MIGVAHYYSNKNTVDAKGIHIHRLSCILAANRMPKHQALKDLIWCALTNQGVPMAKEPLGVSWTDDKCSEVLTLIPWTSTIESSSFISSAFQNLYVIVSVHFDIIMLVSH